METTAVVFETPRSVSLQDLTLTPPSDGDVVVEVRHSAISTGTERLLWTGEMPTFPGMGYPLVPGYEAVGEVVEAGRATGFRPGEQVFVPGSNCYEGARGLFGASASAIVASADRVARIGDAPRPEQALLALAATAHHIVAGGPPPDLIAGHGVLGRLIARIAIARGAAPPVVWETNAARRDGGSGYIVTNAEADERRDYQVICDATGDVALLDTLIGRLAKGGEITLAGFYKDRIGFAFPPAFMKEARLRIAAEWTREDLDRTRALLEIGSLSLDGLISHVMPATSASSAYEIAFEDPVCLKMCLDWRSAQ